MTFNWETPPWLRLVDSSYMAVMITDSGDGISFNSTAVRGDNPDEALADLLMGPGGVGGAPLLPGLIGVVIHEGIDVMWMAQPPIQVERGSNPGEYNIAAAAEEGKVTLYSVDAMREMRERLHAQYNK